MSDHSWECEKIPPPIVSSRRPTHAPATYARHRSNPQRKKQKAPCRLRRGRHEGVSFRATCRLRRGRHEGVSFRATCRLRRGRHEGVSFRATCRLRRGRHEGVGSGLNNIVIPEFSAWLTLVLEQCRAENIRNLPRQRAPTPLFPERRLREACSMPISGCHALPLATFNLPSRNNLQNKPNSAATMSLPCSRFATAQPQRRWDAPLGGGDSGYFHSAIAK